MIGKKIQRGIVFVTKPNNNRCSLHGKEGIESRLERKNRKTVD